MKTLNHFGTRIPSSVWTFSKYSAIAIALFISLLVGQVSQLMVAMNDWQKHEIAEWATVYPEQEFVVNQFIDLCINHRLSAKDTTLEDNLIKEPMGLYECGKAINATELVEHLQKTKSSWLTLAWPLSIFE